MPIPPVSAVNTSTQSRKQMKINPVTVTGYGALVFGTASAIEGYRKKIKPHKYFAWGAGILAFVHTGLVEYRRFNRKKIQKEGQ